ncbi:MAG: hypothetical protein RI924_974 [Bacteroidota bacterium]|jgi:dihydrofolate reductase
MSLEIVVAVDENWGIGKDNQLLWRLPADLKHFKNITSGHPVVMGRKTYESIGRALPNRRNVVISRQTSLQIEGVEVVHSLEEALALLAQEAVVFIIGGAQIYRESVQKVDKIHLTKVHHLFNADAFFPALDPQVWEETNRETHQPDEKNAFSYTFSTYSKR